MIAGVQKNGICLTMLHGQPKMGNHVSLFRNIPFCLSLREWAMTIKHGLKTSHFIAQHMAMKHV